MQKIVQSQGAMFFCFLHIASVHMSIFSKKKKNPAIVTPLAYLFSHDLYCLTHLWGYIEYFNMLTSRIIEHTS